MGWSEQCCTRAVLLLRQHSSYEFCDSEQKRQKLSNGWRNPRAGCYRNNMKRGFGIPRPLSAYRIHLIPDQTITKIGGPLGKVILGKLFLTHVRYIRPRPFWKPC